MSVTTTVPRSQTARRDARSAAVIAVVGQQLAGLAQQIDEPALAGPLGHFAGAARWAAQNVGAGERAERNAPELEALCARARELLGEHPTGSDDEIALTVQLLGDAAGREVPGAAAALGELLQTLTVVEEGTADVAVADDGPTRVVATTGLTSYLRARFGEDALAHDVTHVSGGFSKHTIIASVTFGAERHEIVLRQVPAGRHEQDLPLEFDVLRNVWKPELPIPEPLWIEASHNALGGPFFVSRRAAGQNVGDVFGARAEVPEQFCLDLADFLARLHAVDPSAIAKAPVAPMRAPAEIHAAIEEMAAKAAAATGIGSRLAAVFGWLRAHVPETVGPPAIVHGDVGLHNALVDQGRLSALLDWERSHFGDPVEDLAYLRPTLEPVFSWQAFLDRYVAAGGRPPDPATERFYTVWQDTWRHVECLVLGEDFFDQGVVPMMIAGFVLAPRFLGSALQTAFLEAR